MYGDRNIKYIPRLRSPNIEYKMKDRQKYNNIFRIKSNFFFATGD